MQGRRRSFASRMLRGTRVSRIRMKIRNASPSIYSAAYSTFDAGESRGILGTQSRCREFFCECRGYRADFSNNAKLRRSRGVCVYSLRVLPLSLFLCFPPPPRIRPRLLDLPPPISSINSKTRKNAPSRFEGYLNGSWGLILLAVITVG